MGPSEANTPDLNVVNRKPKGKDLGEEKVGANNDPLKKGTKLGYSPIDLKDKEKRGGHFDDLE